jgi:phosphatidylinositol dimannoside acyltransferase
MADRTADAFRLGAALARRTPDPVAHFVGRVAGGGAAQRPGARRRQVERNLRRVHGPDFGGLALRRAVRRTFESYARYWVESFRLPGTSPDALAAGITTDGWEQVVDARKAGNGVILALPHLGGWEWGGLWASAVEGIPLTVVVERLDPPELFEWFVDLRRQFGMKVVPLGPAAGREVLRALNANEVVSLLCDRDLDGSGVPVDFFGERTTLPGGPATLALRTGAPILPTGVYFAGRGHHGVVRPPVPAEREGRLRDDVARVTQLLAHELEALIRRAPEQWHLLQPNWPSDEGHRDHPAPSTGS